MSVIDVYVHSLECCIVCRIPKEIDCGMIRSEEMVEEKREKRRTTNSEAVKKGLPKRYEA